MTFGTLYTHEGNSRSVGILSIAKENGLELEIKDTPTGASFPTEYVALAPLKKIPFFKQGDFFLTESIAITIYLTSQNEKTTLLGKNKQEYAQILRWLSFGTCEVIGALAGWFRPLAGLEAYNKKNVDASHATALIQLSILESHLLTRTYLVGERISAADFYLAGIVSKGFKYVFDTEFRAKYPNFARWWATISHHPSYVGANDFIDEAIKYTPPAKPVKEAKPPKAAPAPKKKEVEPEAEEEEEAPAAPKSKHPLEALGRSEKVLDDWKRHYSNNDTPVSLKFFFDEWYKPEEWSLWKVDYKYNDELTQVFMSSNLIGGFFNRLEASRKYLFGSVSVYGSNNDSIIQGAFLVRGQEAAPAFDVAPDWESYSFTKLDHTNSDDVAFVRDQWSWDKPITVDGKEYPHADGKVFK